MAVSRQGVEDEIAAKVELMLKSPVLTALREGTRAEHDAIESALDMTGMSLPAYRSLLERFGGFYGPLEWSLASLDWASVGVDFDARRKMPRLVRDLAVLGGVVRSEWVAEPVRDFASAFGVLYVLEGATLGGQVITRNLKRDLAITPELGGAFFAGYGEATREMWVGFCEALAAFAPEPNQQIVDAAIATFQAMRHWCSGWTSQSTGS